MGLARAVELTRGTEDTPVHASSPDGPTGRLATWIAEFDLEQAPPHVVSRACDLILDGLGCALIGAKLPWSATAVEAVAAFEGAGDAAVIGWGRSFGAPAAALLNSTLIQGFELDDFHPLAPLHSASLVIPAVLATSSVTTLSGADMLRAALVGFEVGPRAGLALHGSEMLSRGWHSGAVFGSVATAACVASALRLDPRQVEHALGFGATQSGGLMSAQFGAMGKRMQHGMAARNGLYAGMLARAGYSGIEQVFEQPYGGWLATFGEGHDPDASQLTAELGARWETTRITVKRHAAMGGLHGPIDCLLAILERHRILSSEIEQIDVHLSDAVYHHGWWPPKRPLTPTAAQMNVAYSLAVAAVDGAALAAQYSPRRIDGDDVWRLIPKVRAFHDTGFDELGALGRGQSRLRVTTTSGGVFEDSLFAARSILEPMTSAQIREKFDGLCEGVIDHGRRDAIVDMVGRLAELPDLDELIDLLSGVVGAPFA